MLVDECDSARRKVNDTVEKTIQEMKKYMGEVERQASERVGASLRDLEAAMD